MPADTPDYYTGFTQAEVEAIFAAQKAELLKTMQSFAENATQVTKRRIDEINVVLRGCQAALKRFDPTTYGARRQRIFTTGICGYLEK